MLRWFIDCLRYLRKSGGVTAKGPLTQPMPKFWFTKIKSSCIGGLGAAPVRTQDKNMSKRA